MKELAKQTDDSELKEQILQLYDHLLEMKHLILQVQEENQGLKEENHKLRQQLERKGSVTRNGEFGYYYATGEQDPICPNCWEGSQRQVHLDRRQRYAIGWGRHCRVCNEMYYEEPSSRSGMTNMRGV